MRVLMLETDSPLAHSAAICLQEAGHKVVACRQRDSDNWCRAVEGGSCPLDTDSIDLALVVRPFATSARLPKEELVTCAAVRGVPVVVAGATTDHPYGFLAAAEDEGVDVARTVETIANAPLVDRSVTATAALRADLTALGIEPRAARAEVFRRDGGLLVKLHMADAAIDAADAGRAAVRVAGALRDVDPWAKSIDVVVQ